MMVLNKIIYMANAKSKKTNRKRLVIKLDTLVSKIVRARDKVCVVCLSVDKPTAGHVFSRGTYATRWDMKNVFQQCWPCNYRHVRDQWPYFNWYITKYGQAEFDALRARFQNVKPVKTLELQSLFEQLKEEYKELLND